MPTHLKCRLFGCCWFVVLEDETTVVWCCRRGCGSGWERSYADPEAAARAVAGLARGEPGPPVGITFPRVPGSARHRQGALQPPRWSGVAPYRPAPDMSTPSSE